MKIAIVATEGFEYSELTEPKKALTDAGFEAKVISPRSGQLRGWQKGDWADSVEVDATLSDSDPGQFDALVLPGGTLNADHLRTDREALAFVKHFTSSGKPIAAICHGAWALIEVDYVRSKKMTSVAAIKTDLINAGARWMDDEAVVDGNFVTSRTPDDLPAFNAAFIEVLKAPGVATTTNSGLAETTRHIIDARSIDELLTGEVPTGKQSRHAAAAVQEEKRGHQERSSKARTRPANKPSKSQRNGKQRR
ncbi:MAG: protease [Archangium gephyra]|uniref:Protease n=1 Tax=Archangium gephyra TaxID=48 RepID=A0A2W5THL5_9BACT|nr:MAG: protease [Archangium gephyra]